MKKVRRGYVLRTIAVNRVSRQCQKNVYPRDCFCTLCFRILFASYFEHENVESCGIKIVRSGGNDCFLV